ncbi:MAG: dTDP-4-dehydrorhamnose 3,5-epimerase [Candidatus Baltobacteraceae bacterium]
MPIELRDTKFADAKLLLPLVHRDERGFFKQTFSARHYAAAGITDTFLEDSVSFSKKNTLRGLHFDPRLAKLVQVLHGRAFDVIVDIRRSSPTYGMWQGFELSESNHVQLYVPKCFAHGFLALSDHVVFSYKQTEHYDPGSEGQVLWSDPAIGIAWPLDGEPFISKKDRQAPLLADIG